MKYVYEGHQYQFDIQDVIDELGREIGVREIVFPRWLRKAKSSPKRINGKLVTIQEYQRILDKRLRCAYLLFDLYSGTLPKPKTVLYFKYEYEKGHFETFDTSYILKELSYEIKQRERTWCFKNYTEAQVKLKRRRIALLDWIRDRLEAKYQAEQKYLDNQLELGIK